MPTRPAARAAATAAVTAAIRAAVRAAPKAAAAWAVPALLLAVWQAACSAGVASPVLLPSPASVARAGWALARTGALWTDVGVSAARALTGLAIGGGLGFALGLLNGLSRPALTLLDGTLQMARAVPHLALVPLVILWFGIGEQAKVFLVALGTFFPVYVNTLHGVRSVDPQLIEMARAYGLSRFALARRVVLPGALASVLVGLRYALGVMWLTLIVAETISADSGIGFLAANARELLRTDVVMFAVLLYALLGKLADSIAKLLERRWLSWSPAHGGV